MITPIVQNAGVGSAKTAFRRDVFLHPDTVILRYSGKFLDKKAMNWIDDSKNIPAGTILALGKFFSSTKDVWFPWVLDVNPSSAVDLIKINANFYGKPITQNGHKIVVVKESQTTPGTLEFEQFTITGSVLNSPTVDLTCTGATATTANNAIILYAGNQADNIACNQIRKLSSLTVVPADFLTNGTDDLLMHHVPYQGLVIPEQIRPFPATSAARQRVLKLLLREQVSVGLTGLMCAEV